MERPAIPHSCAYGHVLVGLDEEQYDYIEQHGSAWVKCPGCRHYLLTDGVSVLGSISARPTTAALPGTGRLSQKTTGYSGMKEDLTDVLSNTQITEHLLSYRELQDNWDSYGASKISETAFAEMEAFQRALALRSGFESINPVDIVPVPNGGISIEFRRADRIEIDVDAEGAFGVLEVRIRNGETHRKELQGLTMSEALDALAAFRDGAE